MTNPNAIDILLVEDNSYDTELMMRALTKRGLANRVFVATDGEEALDFLFGSGAFVERDSALTPKVVFLDLKLPKLNGLEVLEAIRSTPATATLPVVVITSSDQDPDIQAAYERGANSYVVKPVAFDAFIEVTADLGFYWLLLNRAPN